MKMIMHHFLSTQRKSKMKIFEEIYVIKLSPINRLLSTDLFEK